MRGALQDSIFGTRSHHLSQVPLDIRGLGGGDVQARVVVFVADEGVDAADHARLAAGSGQDSLDEVDGGRLAIGTGHADDLELAGGVSVEGSRQVSKSLTGVGHLDERD